jgi:hypothetical protein
MHFVSIKLKNVSFQIKINYTNHNSNVSNS